MDYSFSIIIAMIAFVYSVLLTEENALLNGTYNRLYDWFKTDERAAKGKPVDPIFMLIMYCERCIAGQIAFWFFIYENWIYYFEDPIQALLYHFGFVALTIILTVTLKESYIKYKHK